jgi:hypothetical protein
MVVPDAEWEAVGHDAHAMINEAKAAGVYVFGGGIDESVPPALVSASGGVAEGGCSTCPRVKRPSRGPRASRRPVVVTKSYASSGSTRSPEGGIEMAQNVWPNNSFKPTPLRGAA